MASLSIDIQGMTCSSCVSSIETALKQQPGVESVQVSLQHHQATLVYNSLLTQPSALVQVIQDAGFEAQVSPTLPSLYIPIKVSIQGMTCQSCTSSITQALSTLPGTRDIQVSLQQHQATLEIDSSLLNEHDVITTIEDCGFDAQLVRDSLLVQPLHTVEQLVPHFIADDIALAMPVAAPLKPYSSAVGAVGAVAALQSLQEPILQKSKTQEYPLQPLRKTMHSRIGSAMNGVLVNLKVEGMTCASCVASIERHLRSHPGVLSVKVSLLAERADVEINPELIQDPQKVADLINDIGFEASLLLSEDVGEVDLQIVGMTCASCSNKIEKGVASLPGLVSCSVNLLGQSGRFMYSKKQLGVRDIVEKIEELGFNALLAENGKNQQMESLERTKEIKSWKKTFYNSLWFSIPISTLSMILPMLAPDVMEYDVIPGLNICNLAMLLLTIPIQFKMGARFHRAAWKAIKHGSTTMDVLISLGTNISFFFSVLSLLHSIIDPKHPQPTVFFETCSNLITFISLGRWLENKAKGKTSSALSKLISLAPSHAILIEKSPDSHGFKEKRIPAEYIQVGDVLKVVPGERIPSDGIIEYGSTDVDESLVTGEPLPIKKTVKDTVMGGTVNGTGMIHIRATRVGRDTTLSQIVKLVHNAQTEKAPIQQIADKVAGFFVPLVILLGAMTFFIWIILLSCVSDHISGWSFPVEFDPHSSFSHFFVALNFCISVIVVACPCALGLATPTAVMVGTGVGAQLGILIKGGSTLEMGYKITKLVFDKTGTLTMGKLMVVKHQIFVQDVARELHRQPQDRVPLTTPLFFALIGTAESASEHPLGRSIAQHARQLLGIPSNDSFPFELASFSAIPGSGIKCVLLPLTQEEQGGSSSCLMDPKFSGFDFPNRPIEVLLGNPDFLVQHEIPLDPVLLKCKAFHESQGHTVVAVAMDKQCVGFVALADDVKPEAKAAVAALEGRGIQVIMVTGDQEATARVIADKCGIQKVYAGVSPAGKKRIVSELQGTYRSSRQLNDAEESVRHYVAMVGDGVNDSASIAQSDMGIAVYGGTDVAMEAASVVLMRPDLMDVVTAMDLSRTIFTRIRLNFVWATLYNIIMIPLAMGLFSPWNIIMSPMWSGMIMSLSSVSVVVSSLLLKRYKRPHSTHQDVHHRTSEESDQVHLLTVQETTPVTPLFPSIRPLGKSRGISSGSGLFGSFSGYKQIEQDSFV